MRPIKKQLITDEMMHPVAVIISYQDWQEIEAILQQHPEPAITQDLSAFAGSIHLNIDPLDYQKQIRDEWN